MKKTIIIPSVALLSTLLLTQCSKGDGDKVFNASFYTTRQAGRMTLYIDNVYKGELPYLAAVPQCGASDGDGPKPVTMQLPSGEYTITGKNEQGAVISNSRIRISARKMYTSGSNGGLRMDSNGDCLAIGLSE